MHKFYQIRVILAYVYEIFARISKNTLRIHNDPKIAEGCPF